ncbi:transposase [Candidatus Methylacidithermus pantelleriae]|uniref:Transposase IS200-like domain-containing protein n=1 Tax=Candidatus Methylacidithermus pantelleriae TaxID=2744239 RepID=A0A8J2BMT5_9BACT|nr:transposase [Candidatus Methylacidithermus pantelleriae]CAF0691342.1 hypothetical protein MPNT_100014 [Candidatus Methylacidithermus pantelleriae]
MISQEVQPDDIHLFVGIPVAIAVADAVKVRKGVTATRWFQRFPEVKNRGCGAVSRGRHRTTFGRRPK